MISSIATGVCLLILACHSASVLGRVVCGIGSFLFFLVAMYCHRKVVDRVEHLAKLALIQVDINNKVANALTEILKAGGDDLK